MFEGMWEAYLLVFSFQLLFNSANKFTFLGVDNGLSLPHPGFIKNERRKKEMLTLLVTIAIASLPLDILAIKLYRSITNNLKDA